MTPKLPEIPGHDHRTFLLIASFPDSIVKFRGALLEDIGKQGFRVHVACPGLGAENPVSEALEAAGCVTHNISLNRTGMTPLADLAGMQNLWRLMRRVRPDHVLAYTAKPVIYGMLAAWLAGVPRRYALVTGLGYAFTGQARGKRRLIQWLLCHLYRLALGRAHKVFFQNPDDEALFREQGILPFRVPSVVLNGSGVDIGHFAPVPLPEGSPRFLLIARLLGDKGVREYVEAARRVKSEHPQVRFQLVGWIDENPDAIRRQDLDRWIEDGIIEYPGRLQDVRPAIADCSVYVLPSYREGTPRTVLEAMAMGRPVITTDAPGCRETIIDGENGFLVPVRNSKVLAAAMIRYIEQPELIRRMGERARQIAEEKYDVSKVNNIMLREMGLQNDL